MLSSTVKKLELKKKDEQDNYLLWLGINTLIFLYPVGLEAL